MSSNRYIRTQVDHKGDLVVYKLVDRKTGVAGYRVEGGTLEQREYARLCDAREVAGIMPAVAPKPKKLRPGQRAVA